MEARELALYEDVAALKASVSAIEDKLDGLIHYLQGNGQPGAIADLRAEDTRISARLDKFESRNQWLTGLWIGASSVVIGGFELVKFLLAR